MNEAEFRSLKIDLQLKHLIETISLELNGLGFLGVSKMVQLGAFSFHLVVDKTYLNRVRVSPRVQHYLINEKRAKTWIDKGWGDYPVVPFRYESHPHRPWGYVWITSYCLPKGLNGDLSKFTWNDLLNHVTSVDLAPLRKTPFPTAIVDGRHYSIKNANRNGGIALLSGFLHSIDNLRFDYLFEVVNFYGAYLALEEGDLKRLPNCKLSKQYQK